MVAELRYPDVTAHQLVASTATAMAQEVYEKLCSGSNAIYKLHGDRADFVRQCAPTLRAAARTILADMLNSPTMSFAEKETIYDALVLDSMLPKNGTSITHR